MTSRSSALLPRVVYEGGLRLDGTLLWMDSRHAPDLGFVSSASVELGRAPQKLLCSDRTARLLRRIKGAPPLLACPYRRAFTLGSLSLELLPAGSMPGSASLLVGTADRRLLYAGAALPQGMPLAEAARFERADVLVLDGTYCAPHFRFPPLAEVRAQLMAEVAEALAAGQVPVVLVPPVGVAQEVAIMLASGGHALRAHASIALFSRMYRDIGVELPAMSRFQGTPAPTGVLLWPLHLGASPAIRKLRRARLLALTGRALEPGYEARARVHRALPLTNRPDGPELLRIIERVHPSRVYVVHGAAEPFAAELRSRGVHAEAVVIERQTSLF